MIEFQNELTKWFDQGLPFDVFWLDFAKAFNKVDHGRLKAKLEAFGIAGDLLGWIVDWLGGRRQRVVVEGEFSEWEEVFSSVIQGSVIGAILFVIFIDDIDRLLEALTCKFLDDTKGAMVVRTEADAERLQADLDAFVKWAGDWRMEFNIEKCSVMHVGLHNIEYAYQMEAMVLQTCEVEKDLGVHVCRNMKPSIQCQKVAAKANQTLGQIARAFHFRMKGLWEVV